MNNKRQQDIAIATAYFSSLFIATDSFFNSADRAYELAIQFVDKYPPETQWGIDMEYKETLEAFFITKIRKV